ncbi:glycosyl hydrolase family 95 catalytic domain-containing protein [Pedobacter gandavensis]|uniref:Glycosyl hydrolase family 95 catalytic domain-containing protein n=1 Tax=Pedobacter gandavensis TaxID=2679963 RepID=A0ABR6EQC9_9SPHI|nr:hypothetical protein [Pedobacter gandavensis]MBB2147455.1 hypothetical protein [Pedobacter gandavensis]
MKICYVFLVVQLLTSSVFAQMPGYKNNWAVAPAKVPSDVSVDGPLMGNGDVTMSVGFKEGDLSFYIGKNDFWRLRSKADGLSGPRIVGILGLKIDGFREAGFTAEQLLSNGITTSLLKKSAEKLAVKSWISATRNLIFIELKAIDKAVKVSVELTTPENSMAKLKTGKSGDVDWLIRSFVDSVDIPTSAVIALKVLNTEQRLLVVTPGKPLTIALAIESNFKHKNPAAEGLNQLKKINGDSVVKIAQQHDDWWKGYWGKSSIIVQDTVLMKAYYQGLYTMAACSRDPKFPPGIFGWTTTDSPGWNGDYHLNYNFQAPFYGLFSANRIQQARPHDAALLDFMPRGEWYAKNVTHTRGILYPVGIGPMGIEVTRDFEKYNNGQDFEKGGLFFGQRSNAIYGLLNMAQGWRTTYDKAYGKQIYPYALAVVSFWEDYLKYEGGRYVIYGDAIHEGSGKDKNPILSIGLIRNAFDLMIDLSSTLNKDIVRQGKWKDILNKLSDFPVQTRNGQKVFRYTEEGVDWWDGNGLGIQQIYPANAITLDSKSELLTISRNTIGEMKRWHDSNTSNSFFMAAIRVGYDPVVVMKELHNYALNTYPNGFMRNNPHGIENSCTVENALNEMLCMSVGNVIRLFNIPKGQDASFKNIRTWGAFLVSARLDHGLVSELKIISEQGRPCTIVNPWQGKKVLLIRNGKKGETLSGNKITFKTTINEMVAMQLLEP